MSETSEPRTSHGHSVSCPVAASASSQGRCQGPVMAAGAQAWPMAVGTSGTGREVSVHRAALIFGKLQKLPNPRGLSSLQVSYKHRRTNARGRQAQRGARLGEWSKGALWTQPPGAGRGSCLVIA